MIQGIEQINALAKAAGAKILEIYNSDFFYILPHCTTSMMYLNTKKTKIPIKWKQYI